MKKITLFVCLLIIAFVNAQDNQNQTDKLTFEKGTQFVNLNLSLRSDASDFQGTTQAQESKNFGFSINSSYAYAINNNLFLGLGVGYSKNTNEYTVGGVLESESSGESYQIFPYVRYYKGIGEKLALYIQGEVRYSHFENEFNALNDNTSNNFFFGVRPGITYMLHKNLALETSIGALGYTTSKIESNQSNAETRRNAFDLSLNTSNVFFGLNYYF
ncbi:outer membrane beta-barrel protein [Kordia algicida OT-1]|uniref:Outer membrane protein beta-barrel domain-containing protein n=1 Tax=Kordia algicida OT-1 TaxID=391587 RepID=A9DNA8_9FLAO|nr:outer membrane beta-barrel protein [Kordia algicida]EDP97149.1 hypothetical protein KAOT1_18342 [Kordia algicida OT-1]